MNVTLGWFLSHIYSDRDGNTPLVWIYDWVGGFYPDDEGKKGTELLAVFQSDFIPQYTFKEKFCAKVVKEIYWTEQGIVLLVDDKSKEEHK